MPIIGSIDQGTSSSRFLIFDSETSNLIDHHQTEIKHIKPQNGWLEQDPEEIYQSVLTCIKIVVNRQRAIDPKFKIHCIGITNQRETSIIWNQTTQKPLYNAIVWCDSRTCSTVDKFMKLTKPIQDKNYLQNETGLPISTYFSSLKIAWMIENVSNVKKAVEENIAAFGTVDSWLIYRLTNGSSYSTDPTNACRTMLYNINSNNWDDNLMNFFQISKKLNLPKIQPSSSDFGEITDVKQLKGVHITGVLGDQQAALVGQKCLSPGTIKNTYGTGCFLLQNIGQEKFFSKNGLLTTVAYQKQNGQVYYALEGSVAVAGILVRWLRDNLGIINHVSEIDSLARKVDNCGGVAVVPAFNGLFCPHWNSQARGIIVGLTQYSNKSHIARACLESVAWQVKDVIEAMKADGQQCKLLKADGGMTNSKLLMEIQSNILNINVVVPEMKESTALGAAVAAGSTCGVWNAAGWEEYHSGGNTISNPGICGEKELVKVYEPVSDDSLDYNRWLKAVGKSLDWAE